MPVQLIEVLPAPALNWRGMHREYLNPGEMEIIVALVRSVNAVRMIEIGCRDGRTARVMLDHVPSLEHYIGIDVTPDYQPGLPQQRSEMVGEPGLHAMEDARFELLIRPRGSLDLDQLPPCDVVFIDGDHSSKVVAHDTALALAAIRDGGLVIWHDYVSNYLKDVTDVIEGLDLPIQHVSNTWLAFYSHVNV
jgi:predicted O-methyltransferase YrrM